MTTHLRTSLQITSRNLRAVWEVACGAVVPVQLRQDEWKTLDDLNVQTEDIEEVTCLRCIVVNTRRATT